MAIYRGSVSLPLQPVANNDDAGLSTLTSEVRFSVFKGTNYFIAVDGFLGEQGNVKLSLTLSTNSPPSGPPENDNFSNGSVLSGDLVLLAGRNNGATRETNEPPHAVNATGRSVWWRWTASKDAPVYLTASGSTAPVPGPARPLALALAIYQGSELGNLSLVSQTARVKPWSQGSTLFLRFAARTGETYHIAVDSITSDNGDLQLLLNATLIPASLRFSFVGWEPNGLLRLNTASSYARSATLQASADLVHWVSLTNFFVGQTTPVLVSPGLFSTRHTFFRLFTFE